MNELTLKERLINLINGMTEDQLKDILNLIENRQAELRKYIREECLFATDYTIQDKTYKDFIKNISAGGVYIKTQQPHLIGQDISINFALPDYSESVKISGKIVRIDSEGIAVRSLINLELIQKSLKSNL